MKRMKHKEMGGFSLVEVVTAIALLGLVMAPVGASLLLAHRLNVRSEELMQAQLAVTRAVETLMAEGIDADADYSGRDEFSGVTIEFAQDGYAYRVTVTCEPVAVETWIRPAQEPSVEDVGARLP